MRKLFRYSILPALTTQGMIYSKIKLGSYDGDTFTDYIAKLLLQMNPWPAEHSVLVMDNSSIHHVEEVQEMCDDRPVHIFFCFALVY